MFDHEPRGGAQSYPQARNLGRHRGAHRSKSTVAMEPRYKCYHGARRACVPN